MWEGYACEAWIARVCKMIATLYGTDGEWNKISALIEERDRVEGQLMRNWVGGYPVDRSVAEPEF